MQPFLLGFPETTCYTKCTELFGFNGQDLGADYKQECWQPEENGDRTSDWGAKGPEGKTGKYWIYVESHWD